MIDETGKDDAPRLTGGKPRREPRTIDLAAAEVVEETAPLAGGSGSQPAAGAMDAVAQPPEAATVGATTTNKAHPHVPSHPFAPHDVPPGDKANGEAPPAPLPADDDRTGGVASPIAPRRRGSLGAVVTAGILGGVAGAAAAFVAPLYFPSRDDAAERMAALERSLQRQVGAAKASEVEALGGRIGGLEQAVKDVNARLAGVAGKAEETAQRLAALPPPSSAATTIDNSRLAAVDKRIGELEAAVQRITPLETAVQRIDPDAAQAGADALAKVNALEGHLAGIEKAASSARVDRIARVVLAAELARAVEEGRPFTAELAALKTTGLQSPAFAALDGGAAGGVATAESLLADLRGLASAIIAESVPAPDGGVLDRLTASAARLVSVRPVDGAGGSSPGAIVTQIETALERGDVAEALRLWKSLPETGRRASQAFGQALEARVAAGGAARALAADATAQLKGN